MSDKRRKQHAAPEKVRIAIIKTLKQKPLQAKDIRTALSKKGKSYDFSRDRLNDILLGLIEQGEITRIVLDEKPYPLYAVTEKSKILAEIQGQYFQAHLKRNMFDNDATLLEEFKKKENRVDPFLKFFGFYVVGSLLVSYGLDKKHMTDKTLEQKDFEELRQEWLKPVLNLQNGSQISEYFDSVFDTKKGDLVKIITELNKSYKKNMAILNLCYDNSNLNNPKLKKLSDETFDKTVIDALEKLKKI